MPLIELVSPGVPPFAAYGACYLCRTASDETYVKTGVDIEWEGELVFCESCVKGLAAIIGFKAPQSVAKCTGEAKKLAERVAELEVTEAEYNALRTALNAAGVKTGS